MLSARPCSANISLLVLVCIKGQENTTNLSWKLPGESQGRQSLVGCHLWDRTHRIRHDWSDLAAAAASWKPVFSRQFECYFAHIISFKPFQAIEISNSLCRCCYCSVAKSCLTLCDPRDCSMLGSSILHYLPELLKFVSIESVILSNHLILCCPLILFPSAFPSVRIFSHESALHIR